MPSTTGRQHRFMEAVAHDAQFAKKAGVPQQVGKEYAKADETGHGLMKKKSKMERMYKDAK